MEEKKTLQFYQNKWLWFIDLRGKDFHCFLNRYVFKLLLQGYETSIKIWYPFEIKRKHQTIQLKPPFVVGDAVSNEKKKRKKKKTLISRVNPTNRLEFSF